MPETVTVNPPSAVNTIRLPPWKNLAPKQKDLMQMCRWKTGRKKFIGVFGTRKSGKTHAILNCISDHMWSVKNAAVLILAGTQGSAATSGVWNVMTEQVLPEWFEHDICKDDGGNPMRMKWATKGEPRATISKKLVCATTNMHGGTSKLELDSLDNEKEVESKFKSRYYTMIVWSEAGEFKEMLTLTTLMMALRGVGYKEDDFVLLVDANPPDEGQDHFLFKFFYELRLSAEVTKEEKAIQECLYVTEWSMADNPYLSENEKDAIKGMYMHDPVLYDRYVRGLWTKAIRDAVFADMFRYAVHVFSGPRDPDPKLLLPTEGCVELITGHDAGFVNPVTYILEQIPFIEEIEDKKNGEKRHRQVSFFQYLDELSLIGKETSVAEFTQLTVQLLDFWENEIGREIAWWHYADLSALNFKESIANRTVADEMYAESNGRIRLIGVEKGSGSIALRIQLMRRLLAENRILISGLRCPKLIEMFQSIKRGKLDGTIAPYSLHKHQFDAASYPLVKRCFAEVQNMVRSVRVNARKANREDSDLVCVKL